MYVQRQRDRVLPARAGAGRGDAAAAPRAAPGRALVEHGVPAAAAGRGRVPLPALLRHVRVGAAGHQ